MKLGEQIKQFKCRVAQGFNQLGVTFFLVKAAISPQFSLNFGVIWKRTMFRQAQLAGSLALGLVIISNAIFRHQTGSGTGDVSPVTGAWALAFMTGHGGSIRVKSPPF